jgi:hypothetical protein
MNAFAKLPHISEVRPRGPEDDPVFAEVAAVLERHNALGRFGLFLRHVHFDIADGEVLLEETDEEARVQTLKPVRIDSLQEPGIETAWNLDAAGHATTNCICPTDRHGNHLGRHIKKGG